MLNKIIITAAAVTVMAGCATMAPDYQRPDMPVKDSWSGAKTEISADKKASDIAWKDYFRSENMQKVIQTALDNNRDLRTAALNIEKARAAYRIQKADLIPSVNLTAEGARTAVPENASSSGSSVTSSSFSANVNTSYEIDFFGKVRSLNEAALRQYMATEEARTAAQMSLIAETANAYITYLSDAKLLQISKDTLKTRQDSYSLVKKGFDAGVRTELDLVQAVSAVEAAKASIQQYTRAVELDKNALTLLAGAEIDESLLKGDLDNVEFVKELPVGLPSDVLLNRPDVRQSEQNLMAYNANIGAARAAFFPSVSLTGYFGVASSELGNLFSSGSAFAWSFSPQINLPIFDAGRNKITLENANNNQKIAAAAYEKTIQTAFKEVMDGLSSKATYSKQFDAQKAQTAAAQRAYELSLLRYEKGVDSYLGVLDAQRSLFSAQQALISVRTADLSSRIALYKALGGGQK